MPLVHGIGHGVSFTPKKAAVVTPPAPAAETVLLLHFDDNVTDAAGRHTLTPTGSVSYVNGRFGKAAGMAGGGQYLTLSGNLQDIEFASGKAWCIEAWLCNVAPNSFSNPTYIYSINGAYSKGITFEISAMSNTSIKNVTVAAKSVTMVSTYISGTKSNIPLADHTHIAISWDKSKMRLYINGEKIAETTPTLESAYTVAEYIFLYQYQSAGLHYFDELRITQGDAVYTGDSFTVPSSPFTV